MATPSITAIIPAYNEAERISAVLDVVTTYPFHEVLVSDDGSTDNLATVIKRYPTVRLIRSTTNYGKGHAMEQAVAAASGDIIFFCDADVRGLTHQVITATVEPVQRGEVDMFIAMRNRKIYFIRLLLRFIPLLGGERALTKTLWHKIPDYYKERFRIEAALNFFAVHEGRGFAYDVFPGLTQTIKERKMGWVQGLLARWHMIRDIVAAELKVRHHYLDNPLPEFAKVEVRETYYVKKID